jgi:phage-related protein
MAAFNLKPVIWIGNTRAIVSNFPNDVKDSIGFALYIAQQGGKHAAAKVLRGFGAAHMLEIIADHMGDTYRAVYTVRMAHRIYVLHAFQKKSKSAIKTPKSEIDLIRSRMRRAEQEHASWLGRTKG